MSIDVETINEGVVTPEMDLPWFRIREDGNLRWEASRNLSTGGWDVWDVAARPSQRLPQDHPDHDRIVTICKGEPEWPTSPTRTDAPLGRGRPRGGDGMSALIPRSARRRVTPPQT